MAKYITTDTELTSIANAIRAKGGTSASLEYPDEFISAIQNIPSGGSSSSEGDVIFIDYDGSIVDAKSKAEINAMTSDSDLPANPTHTGLTAQGWNWTVTQLKAQLTAMPDQKIYVGQMYVTTSGATEIDVVMQEGRLNPTLTICPNGTILVDWGDDTTPDEVTGSSYTTKQAVSHTYARAGNYTIKISKTSGDGYAFYGSSTYLLLRKNATSASENIVYANAIQNIRIGNNARISNSSFLNCYSLASITIPNTVTSIGSNAFCACYSLTNITIPSTVTSIGSSAFQNCSSLARITIPSTVTSIGSSAFYGCYSLPTITIPSTVTSIGNNAFCICYSLTSIIIPSSVTSIGSNAFQNCYSLTRITIPSTVTSIGGNAFCACYSLTNITIPSTVTSIGSNAFYSCYSLARITIPSDVASIGNSAFQYCYGMSEYHFQSETVPTGGTTMFANIASDGVIYVPYSADHSILEAYKTATNWSIYASYMQEEPQS